MSPQVDGGGQGAQLKFLHSMLRVSIPMPPSHFFNCSAWRSAGAQEMPEGKFTLIFLGVPDDDGGGRAYP